MVASTKTGLITASSSTGRGDLNDSVTPAEGTLRRGTFAAVRRSCYTSLPVRISRLFPRSADDGPVARAACVVIPVLVAAGWLGCASESDSVFSPVEKTDAATSEPDGGVVIPDPGQDATTFDARPSSPTCAAYCDDIGAACTGDSAAYTNKSECLAVCDTMPLGTTGERAGDSVACRDYFATVQPPRCGSAGPWGGETCGSRCESFCRAAEAVCPAAYETVSSCIKLCAATPGIRWDASAAEGFGGPTTGNTLNCRANFLRSAAVDPTLCANVALVSPACQ
jgi:hypothetical protein